MIDDAEIETDHARLPVPAEHRADAVRIVDLLARTVSPLTFAAIATELLRRVTLAPTVTRETRRTSAPRYPHQLLRRS